VISSAAELGAACVKDAQPLRALICFGVFELDPESRELRKQGLKVRLQEQPFQILQILLERPGKVVTLEELQQRIWPADTFVDFDQGLYNATKKLREALGDSADAPRYVETLSRRGYRFIGTLNGNGSATPAAADVPPKSPTAETRASRRRLKLGIALGLGAAALIGAVLSVIPAKVWQRLAGKDTVPQIRSLAVLPLQNLSADTSQEYFSDGMTDALITDLAQISSVKVISRTSVMHYKKTDKTLPEIARELNVDGIVEGTVQRSGDRVRITAQLIYGPSDKHVWASSYERDVRDVFALQRDITDEITRQIQARVTTPNQASPAPPRPVDPKVLEAYIAGSYHLRGYSRGAGDDEVKKAQAYFQQAIDADPNFAAAYIGLARAHQTVLQGSKDDLPIMRRAAEKAVELDPSSSDAWVALADAKSESWDRNGAEEEYRRAIALNSNNAQAHDGLGGILDMTGRLDEGWKEYQLAQQLDPNQDHLANALYQRGQFDRAIEIRQRIAQSDPMNGYNHYALAMIYALRGMYEEFAQEMGTSFSLYGAPEVGNRLQRAYDKSGYQGALRQWAKDMEHLAATKQVYVPGILAQVYTALGDKDRAFYWLEEHRQHRDLARTDPTEFFKTDPWLAPLRSDPRFSDFLRRVGLPP
jgi:TolB-like protein/DNA-binding winged helix-turn-helix (wHTH) protein/Flp pilus assembly protein TadD